MKKMLTIIAVLSAVSVVAVLHGCGGDTQAQGPVEVAAGWMPPTYGTPVVRYVVQHSENDGPWVTIADAVEGTTYAFTVDYFADHRVRVAGVDAEGRQGPYSLPSNTYNPSDNAPGMPANVQLGEAK